MSYSPDASNQGAWSGPHLSSFSAVLVSFPASRPGSVNQAKQNACRNRPKPSSASLTPPLTVFFGTPTQRQQAPSEPSLAFAVLPSSPAHPKLKRSSFFLSSSRGATLRTPFIQDLRGQQLLASRFVILDYRRRTWGALRRGWLRLHIALRQRRKFRIAPVAGCGKYPNHLIILTVIITDHSSVVGFSTSFDSPLPADRTKSSTNRQTLIEGRGTAASF